MYILFFIVAILAATSAVRLIWKVQRNKQLRSLITGMTTTKIHNVDEGLVKLKGIVIEPFDSCRKNQQLLRKPKKLFQIFTYSSFALCEK